MRGQGDGALLEKGSNATKRLVPRAKSPQLELIIPTITRLMENWIGKLGAAAAIAVVIRNESPRPVTPPIRQIETASIRNCSRIVRRSAPL